MTVDLSACPGRWVESLRRSWTKTTATDRGLDRGGYAWNGKEGLIDSRTIFAWSQVQVHFTEVKRWSLTVFRADRSLCIRSCRISAGNWSALVTLYFPTPDDGWSCSGRQLSLTGGLSQQVSQALSPPCACSGCSEPILTFPLHQVPETLLSSSRGLRPGGAGCSAARAILSSHGLLHQG